MKCRHCGKEYDESYSYCPYCAEPKPKPQVEQREDDSSYHTAIVAQCIAIPIGVFIATFLFMSVFAIIPAVLSLVIVILYHAKKPEYRKNIEKQFYKDKKSICPICGSHSVALGRKGYDWNRGFWYRIFNFKGGHYIAGMDSRRVTAHCQNCGHSWLTNEEWIR